MLRNLLEIALTEYKDTLLSKEYLIDLFSQDKISFYRQVNADYGYGFSKISLFVKKNFPDKEKKSCFRNYLLLKVKYKYCTKCKIAKPIQTFNVNIARPDKLSTECKLCFSGTYKSWYNDNAQSQIQRVQQRNRNQDRSLTEEEIDFIFDRDEHMCKQCGLSNEDHLINFGQRLHLDHIKPLSKGGLTAIENIQLLCRSCNSSKKDH